ncbi:MAG: hypothetical protein OXC67_02050 [Flavobacteriaceae bacterium]|nr:hypothetical protein [Flavobacteriaceae bacterium]
MRHDFNHIDDSIGKDLKIGASVSSPKNDGTCNRLKASFGWPFSVALSRFPAFYRPPVWTPTKRFKPESLSIKSSKRLTLSPYTQQHMGLQSNFLAMTNGTHLSGKRLHGPKGHFGGS